LPNFVYRWTERDVEQTIHSMNPTGSHRFRYFYRLVTPSWQLSKRRNPVFRLLARVLRTVEHFAPAWTANVFAAMVVKPTELHPWLACDSRGDISLRWEWLEAKYGS
jgi:hypothetical protein